MTEYITKGQAVDEVWDAFTSRDDPDLGRVIEENIERLPAADVVEVVRCKDCKYKNMESGEFDGLEPACRFWTDADAIYPVFVDMNGFCSEGRRRGGGESE